MVITPSATECLRRMNEVLNNEFDDNQDLQGLLSKFAAAIGDREVADNAVNLKWFLTTATYPIQPVIIEVLNAGWYEKFVDAIYAEQPDFAAATIVLFKKIIRRE